MASCSCRSSIAACVHVRTRGLAVGRGAEAMGDASFPSMSSFHPPPLSGISHQGMALQLRIAVEMAGDDVVGRIAHQRETDLAKADAVVGAWNRSDVACYNVMPTNRDGASEDYDLTRTCEGEFQGE